MDRFRRCWSACLLMALASPAWSQSTFFVPDDFGTIQAAVDASSGGDRVLVRPGTYVENVQIAGKDIELVSTSGPRMTTIEAATPGAVIQVSALAQGPFIQGFTLTGGNGVFGGGVDSTGASPTIVDCVIRDNMATVGGGIGTRFPGTATVINCEISDNNALIGGGLSTLDTGLIAINCTVFRNVSTQGQGGGLWSDCLDDFNCPGAVLRNTIFWSNAPNQIEQSQTPTQVDPIVESSDVQGGYPGAGNIDEPPMFVNGQQGDFYLELGSACIDAGDTGANPLAVDLDGFPRVLGSNGKAAVDIGAREYAGERFGQTYCAPAVVNTSGRSGQIHAYGSAFAGANDFHLVASLLPSSQFGYFIASQTQGVVIGPGTSDGILCLGSPFKRLFPPVLNSGPGLSFILDLDLSAIPAIGSIGAGETWNFQAWFREPGGRSNFTDGVLVNFL